jgi:ATPase subunit of ABC transporter with duplicated ATPase domains
MQSVSLLNISFSHPGGDELFHNVSAAFDTGGRVAIIGDNGSGKTTLLKIISGELQPQNGKVIRNASVYLLPQIIAPTGQSGGERQRLALAAAFNSGADILLLDEPTNNLDAGARREFFRVLSAWRGGTVIASHDQEILNRADKILELSNGTIRAFGGNYDFYISAKNTDRDNMEQKLTDAEKKIARLNKAAIAAKSMRDSHVAKQKKDLINRKRDKNACNRTGLIQKSETTESKRKKIIKKKLDKELDARQKFSELLRDDKIKVPIPAKPFLPKILTLIENLSFGYDKNLIFNNFNLQISGGERVRIAGKNGSGKTTLLRLILGTLRPHGGSVKLFGRAAYLNQDLSLLDPQKSVVQNIMDLSGLKENQSHAIAADFGFKGRDGMKIAGTLSGGELLKATLAAILGNADQPDILILDEPTNNLDIKSTDILSDALNQYKGAILLVSHNDSFADNIGMDKTLLL